MLQTLSRPAVLRWPTGGFDPSILQREGSLVADWNADDHGTARMTDDGAGLISAWADAIGGISAIAVTAARPTWTATGWRGVKAGLLGDGVANCVSSVSLSTLPTAAVAGEIVVLCDIIAASAIGFIASYGSTGTNTRAVRNSATGKAGLFDGTTTLAEVSGTQLGPMCISGAWRGTQQMGWVQGRLFRPPSTEITTLNTGTTRIRLWAATNTSAASFSNCVIRRAMVLTGILTDRRRAQLHGWLMWDGGIPHLMPPDHPFRYVRP